MPYKNKEDQKAAARRHYEDNKDVYKQRAKAHKVKMVEQAQMYVRGLKSNPCTDCGGLFHPVAMDFDHLGDKERNIADMVRDGSLIANIDKEVAKCELVCSNCHRLRTAKRGGWLD